MAFGPAYWTADRQAEDPDGYRYYINHTRVSDACGPAWMHQCTDCDLMADHWSSVHGTDGSEDSHFQPRCRWCHYAYDRIAGQVGSDWYARWLAEHPGQGHKP